MKARAPGKVVLSGAYAVLRGAPALVSAVDRYVVADTALPAQFITPEVAVAVTNSQLLAPWFDASALRANDAKLGLGSSAAILVASLAALELEREPALSDALLAQRVLLPALTAHRQAQGGGSGIDVAASTFGGLFIFQMNAPATPEPVTLPEGSVLEIWNTGTPASTAAFLAAVNALEAARPFAFRTLMAAQTAAASDVAISLRSADLAALIDGLQRQRHALHNLGTAAGIPIVTQELQQLAELAAAEGAALLPAGAGGGDIASFVGARPPSARLRERATAARYEQLSLKLGARGVHAIEAAAPYP